MNTKELKNIVANDRLLNLSQKSYSSECAAFSDHLFTSGNYDLGFYQTLKYYSESSPVFTATDWIAGETSRIEPLLYDKTSKQYIDNNDLIKLLMSPNSMSTYDEFAYAFCAYYILSGNVFIIATGDVTKPPSELFIASPVNLTIDESLGYYPNKIRYNYNGMSLLFERNEINGQIRFFTRDKKQELYHVRTFNSNSHRNHYWGMSQLAPSFYEIEQYLSSSKHNLSILKRGGRPSAAFIYENRLSQEQQTRLQQEMDVFYAGDENSGRMLILEGGFDYKELSKTAKDMDFYNLKVDSAERVYNALKIPLPLVSSGTMTMANMELAKLNLYDNAVLPMADIMMAQLSRFLLPRFAKESSKADNVKIFYDTGSILALAPRRNDELVKYSQINALSRNELRAIIGYEPVEGGDVFFEPGTMVPVASDVDTDNPERLSDIKASRSSQQRYLEIMRRQVDANGDRIYTDKEIMEIARQHGLV